MKRIWFTLLFICLVFASAVWAEDGQNKTYQWEVVAPAGSEMDLKEDKLVYFGTETSPVVLTSSVNSFKLTAQRVEYFKGREVFFAQGKVVVEGEDLSLPPQRFFAFGEEVIYTVNQGELEFTRGGTVRNQEGDTLRGERILIFLDKEESTQKVESFEVSGGFELLGNKGRMTGDTLKGEVRQGLMEATGKIDFQYNETSGTAEKAIYSDRSKEGHLLGSPVIYQGDDHITGEKIIYYLDTEQIKVIGPVKARLYR